MLGSKLAVRREVLRGFASVIIVDLFVDFRAFVTGGVSSDAIGDVRPFTDRPEPDFFGGKGAVSSSSCDAGPVFGRFGPLVK